MDQVNMGRAKYRPVVLGIAILLFIWCAWTWASLRGLPDILSELQPGPWVQHSVTADYTIGLRSSTLYPNGVQLKPGNPTIPMKLFSWANMTITDVITYSGSDIASGEYWVDLRVRAGELWHKDYPVLSKKTVDPASPTIETSFTLPLAKLITDIGKIEKEIGMASPTGKYEVDVRLHTALSMTSNAEVVREYVPLYTFTIGTGGLVLEAPKETTIVQREANDVTVERPNTRHFFGQLREVESLKSGTNAGIVMAGLLLVSAIGWSLSVSKAMPKDPGRRYRDRLVKVTEVGSSKVELSVRVGGLKELARIADEAQVAIMELGPEAKVIPPEFDRVPTPELMGRRFFLVAGSTLYYVV